MSQLGKSLLGAPRRVKMFDSKECTNSTEQSGRSCIVDDTATATDTFIKREEPMTVRKQDILNLPTLLPWEAFQQRKSQDHQKKDDSSKGFKKNSSNDHTSLKIAMPDPPPLTFRQQPSSQQQTQAQSVSQAQPQNIMIGTKVIVDNVEYQILKEIGKGGTSTVYCALRQDAPNPKDSLVALKHVVGTENVNALKEEIDLLIKLKHVPQVVQHIAHDISTLPVGILVMELGQVDISQCIQELTVNRETGSRESLNFNKVRFFFEGMVEAVRAIHKVRIVHGDLKPANFVFVKGKIKLIDFGIAKSIKDNTINISRETQTGTMNYIPPEALLETF